MKKATLIYMIERQINEVWMAKKTRKIGVGYYFGYGGKIEPGQTAIESIIEETREETGGIELNPQYIEAIVLIDFYKGDTKSEEPTFRVICYRIGNFEGIPISTEEMEEPDLFKVSDLTYEKMKSDKRFKPGDELFVPQIIRGEHTKGWIWFSEDSKEVLDYKLAPCSKEEIFLN